MNTGHSPTKSLNTLESVTHQFARRLRQQFAREIALNPRDFKEQVIRLIRRELPPRRGRPTSPQIEAALAMLRQGKSVRQVLRMQVPGFDQLDTYGRYLMEKALRQAIARRRTGRRPRQYNPRVIPPVNTSKNAGEIPTL